MLRSHTGSMASVLLLRVQELRVHKLEKNQGQKPNILSSHCKHKDGIRMYDIAIGSTHLYVYVCVGIGPCRL